jgi:hypothetical protein
MTAAISRAVMYLAICCLGESRREWALAMHAEFEVAIAEGKPFAFATGCLAAAWREMPKHSEGRFVLANYALAIGLLIPMAVFQFGLALGFSSVFMGEGWSDGIVLAGATQNPYLAWFQHRAALCLLIIWLLLGMGHLRLAWVLVDRDWTRVVKVSALIAATTATLFILTGVLLLDVTFVILQAAAMAIELMALVAAARGHARLFRNAASEMAAR